MLGHGDWVIILHQLQGFKQHLPIFPFNFNITCGALPMSVRGGEWSLMTEDLSKFPQGAIIRQLISVQAIHDIIVCHDILDLALVMSDEKGMNTFPSGDVSMNPIWVEFENVCCVRCFGSHEKNCFN